LEELQQYQQAVSAFDLARRISPDNPYARAHRGLSLMYLGNYQEAAADLNRSFRIQPSIKTIQATLRPSPIVIATLINSKRRSKPMTPLIGLPLITLDSSSASGGHC
jgi:tetratricopeptide (TPR) repeat protein